MKRGEKPEGYRHRPKTFPASNYTGSSKQMLIEIRESLRHLPKPSDAAKTDQGAAKAEDPRQGRNPPKFLTYHKALAEIRNSLQPFANSSGLSHRASLEVNRQMLHDLQAAGFDEEMVVRALQQTNSRSIEAAIEYISRMSYPESFREPMIVSSSRPLTSGMKPQGSIQHSVNRRQSWKGSKETLVPQRHISPLSESVVYGSENPSQQSEIGRPLSGSGLAAFTQGLPGNPQRVNLPPPPQMRSVTPPPPPPPPPRGQTPPPRGTTPPLQSWDPNSQNKRYSGNMEFIMSRISPVPPGGWQEGYPPASMNSTQMMNTSSQGQRAMNQVLVGRQPIIIQGSNNSKFGYAGRAGAQNGNGQTEFLVHQGGVSVGSRQPPPPYPMSNGPNSASMQMQGSGGPMSPSAYNNGNLPQSMLVPNRNSHNMELYNIAMPSQHTSWPQQSPGQSPSGSGHEMPPWQPNIPVRSNSFNNPLASRPVHPANTQPSATTVTAITPAPIQQPVKSMRVLKPELQTALAPTHPSWMAQSVQTAPFPEPVAHSSNIISPQPEAPNYQGPPPPYPKHLFPPTVPVYDAGQKSNKEDAPAPNGNIQEGERCSEATSEPTEKEKKQITTSPVPVRKNKKDEERRESRIQSYSPQAFKFFMEQHVENILKSHHQRLHRKKQLENEMMRMVKTVKAGAWLSCSSLLF
ncbi:serine/threonine-protein kinase LATS1 isoform X2 [Bombina bombina]|uniref:serine/threonine-protein kinase LATS1 isoform X2 n=1 Tax=Bombina bombina TaxID=8345 RepID=UPI00235A93AF|nr:serine/threonine-protein kinase LATS1 isoform X2 [Bombina bombina]